MPELTNTLLTQIQKKAEEEALVIKNMSKEKIERKTIENAEKKTAILQKIENETQNHIKRLDANLKSSIEMEQRRTLLKEQEIVITNILNGIHHQMREMIKETNYKEVLLNWICEGAIGLTGDSIEIQTSPEELKLLTTDLLKEASLRIEKLAAKRKVSFIVNTKDFILGQGVVLFSADKKLKFSNTISDRLARYDSQVRTYIFQTVFKNS